jgi:hypothetical protein
VRFIKEQYKSVLYRPVFRIEHAAVYRASLVRKKMYGRVDIVTRAGAEIEFCVTQGDLS